MRLSFILMSIACSALIFGNTVAVPNGNLTFAGNASNALPTTSQSIEFQELVGSGQLHSSPITITGISFRAKPGAGPVNGTIGSLTVTLSTSPNFPNTSGGGTLMSSTFANNTGKDKIQVFSGSNVPLKDAGCATPGPCPFDINIVFQTPFVYKTSGGALLIDVTETNFSATGGTLDGVSFNAPGGGVATVAGAVGSAAGTFAYEGPIVQITYTTTAPVISGVVNVASNIPPGMPNYGIAQGALFAIYGSNMGPANLAVSPLPLPTSGLSGTSIVVSTPSGGVPAPVYFTRNDVVVGVMPSNVSPGNDGITLIYNGQMGTMPITIVQSNFGISNNVIQFADNGVGVLNTAAVTFPNFQPVTGANTAKRGDVLTVWGTGLGATPNNGGDTGAPPFGNIGSAPQVFVGGVASPSVSYWGRAPGLIPGLDQINFEVPPDAPTGCNVSIVVQMANGTVSNGPTIALADSDGATCSDPTERVTSSDFGLSSAKVIDIDLRQNTSINKNSSGTTTSTISSGAEALFFQLTQAQIATLAPLENVVPSFGSCYVGINGDPDASGPFPGTILNGGPTVTLTPPSGTALTLTSDGGDYSMKAISSAIPSGMWTFSNGSGGPDVGPLSFKFPVPAPVTWSNQSDLAGSMIDRTKPLTITWTGGDSNGYVDIQGGTQAGSPLSGFYSVGFECAAPVSAGQFTIPPSILLAMPPNFASLQVGTSALPNILGAVAGFDAAVSGTAFNTSIPVMLK